MYNFENLEQQENPQMSNYYDNPLQSSISNNNNSYLTQSQLSQTPEPIQINQYGGELSPQTYFPQQNDFQTPIAHQYKHKNNGNNLSEYERKNQSQSLIVPKQIESPQSKIVIQNPLYQASSAYQANEVSEQQEDNMDEIQLLKQYLKNKYKHYSEQQIDDIIHKFRKEYLEKIQKQNLMEEEHQDENLQQNFDEDFVQDQQDFEEQEEQSRDSLSTNLDWNDKIALENYCKKQKKIEKIKDFRPSEYFGAITVDKLEDGIDDSRIDELFLDCFGLKPKPKQREKATKPDKKVQNNKTANPPISNNINMPIQINQSNNGVSGDQQCNIIYEVKVVQKNIIHHNQIKLNHQDIYHHFQKMSQDQQYQQEQDEYPQVLYEKTNQDQSKKQCQVLDQDKKNMYQQDQLKQFMSPSDQQKLKHIKTFSEPLELDNNSDFQKCVYKTDDNRSQQFMYSQKQSNGQNCSTQVGSPSSMSAINRHLYNQSITSSQNFGIANTNQSLTHQSSLTNFIPSSANNSSKSKHQANLSLNKQTYKNILYKHQNPNFHSVSSQSSFENKPKQMNKLSYLVAKHLPDQPKQVFQDQQQFQHNRMNSQSSMQSAPKPPQNQSVPLSAKNTRNSKENTPIFDGQQDSFYMNESSPVTVSPKQILLTINPQNQPNIQVNQFKIAPQPFSIQNANTTYQQNYKSMLQQSISKEGGELAKTLVQQSIENFKKSKQSLQSANTNPSDGSSTQRSKNQKTLGRNQSQNFFKSSNTINGIQSFLLSTGELQKQISKNSIGSDIKINYLESEEIQTSPIAFTKKYETNNQAIQGSSRPQTSINNNFSQAAGINQYMINANNLGKPPSKLVKGLLSHNSSAKNLKLQSKNLTINTQTAQNSSRKQNYNNHHNIAAIQSEFNIQSNHPQSTRHANQNGGHLRLQASKPTSLSKERPHHNNGVPSKSMEKSKLKIFTNVNQENEMGSLERKRMLYKSQKTQQDHTKFLSNTTKAPDRKQSQSKNHSSQVNLSKGKSSAYINEYLNPQIISPHQSKAEQTSNRTMQKINKSLDKINSMFSNATSQQITAVHPQSTKHSNGIAKVNEILSQITNYQSFIKKAKADKEITNIKQQQSKPKINSGNSRTRKDLASTNSLIDGNIFAKKTTDTYKKYLSGTQQTSQAFNSFK